MLLTQNLLSKFFVVGILSLIATSASYAQSTSAKKSATQYFTIMGEVVQPGVYELNSSSPFLSNLVKISGGLTKNATGHLRIVRQGRARQQTFFTPSLNLKLLPGDVIVADSKNSGHSKYQMTSSFSPDNKKNSKQKQEYVQLGFINLKKHPIVVKMHRDYATVPQLVKLLGQPPETIKTIRVVSSSQQRRNSAILPNCSLLIFEKPVPYPEKIPELPATLTTSQLAHAGPIGIDEPNPPQSVITEEVTDQSQSLNTPLMLNGPTLSQNNGNNNEATSEQESESGTVVILPPPENSGNIAAGEMGDSHFIAEKDIPLIPVEVPAPPIMIETPAPTMLVDGAENNSTREEKSKANALNQVASSMSTGNIADIKPTQVEVAEDSPSNAMTYILGAMLILGGGIFVWAVSPRKINSTVMQEEMQGRAVEVKTETVVAQNTMAATLDDSILEAMINDELPIITEQVILPVSLELYGHPTGHEKLRIDASHELAQPHFKPSIPESAIQDEASQMASAMVAPSVRIDPAINLEGSIDATRSPLVSPAKSQNKSTRQKQ